MTTIGTTVTRRSRRPQPGRRSEGFLLLAELLVLTVKTGTARGRDHVL